MAVGKAHPSRQLTTLDGDPGLGLSLLTIDLAARITTGKPMPDGTPGVKGSVVLIAPEDGAADTIKPRVEAAGGDPSHIRLLTVVKSTSRTTGETLLSPFTLAEHFSPLIRTVNHTLPTLVILDPLLAVLGSGSSAFHEQKIRKHLSLLALLAQQTNCAALLVRHLHPVARPESLSSRSPPQRKHPPLLRATGYPQSPASGPPPTWSQRTGRTPSGNRRTLTRQLLRRMLNAGDIISPAYGLYTLPHHPSPETPFSQKNATTPTTPATPATPPQDS